jgi:hypothetical protein
MRHILIAATITACTAAVATAAAMAAANVPMRAAAAAPPCKPKIIKIQGHQAAVDCGPATATLHISGKTGVPPVSWTWCAPGSVRSGF